MGKGRRDSILFLFASARDDTLYLPCWEARIRETGTVQSGGGDKLARWILFFQLCLITTSIPRVRQSMPGWGIFLGS